MSIRLAEHRDIDDILRLLTQVNMVHHRIRPDLFKGPATKYSREELEEKIRSWEDHSTDDRPEDGQPPEGRSQDGQPSERQPLERQFPERQPLEDQSPNRPSRTVPSPKDPVFVFPDDDGHILGYIFCEAQEVAESPLRTGIRTLYIDDLCVDETARGRHVGRQLYEYAIAYARANGFYNVTLHVWGGNDPALKFYQKMGMQNQYLCLEQIL